MKLRRIVNTAVKLCYAGCMAAILLTPYDLNSLKKSTAYSETFFEEAAPAEVGMDAGTLAPLSAYVREKHPGISGIIAIKDDRCFYEEYFGGHDAGTPFEINSVTKTVIGSLVGCAVDRGVVEDENVPFAELANVTDYSEDFGKIRIADMLTMSSGIDWERVQGSVSLRLDVIQYGNEHYFDLMKDFPIKSSPGEEFYYDSYESRSTMAALSRKLGKEDYEIASEYLFDALGIKSFVWPINESKLMPGGQDLYLTLRQLSKFGNLYANEGQYLGAQVVSRDWVERSLTAQKVAESEDCSPADTIGYGYYWWCLDNEPVKIRFAFGAGGQYIFVAPEQHLTVAISSVEKLKGENYRDIMLDYFVPALQMTAEEHADEEVLHEGDTVR